MTTPKTRKVKAYPATQVVHWPSGPVSTCDAHGRALVALSTMLGTHIAVTKLTALDEQECSNCKNETHTPVPKK